MNLFSARKHLQVLCYYLGKFTLFITFRNGNTIPREIPSYHIIHNNMSFTNNLNCPLDSIYIYLSINNTYVNWIFHLNVLGIKYTYS